MAGSRGAAALRVAEGHLLADEFNLAAAAAFYLIYLVGLVHFAIRPLDAARQLRRRLLDAALYGFVTYST